jgi:outer membrane protein OmpA-like peptidoglycan-associated protein
MIRVSPPLGVLAIGLAMLACVPKHAKTTAGVPDLVVLLPDPGKTTAGRAVVSNDHGNLDLASPLAAARITAGAAPEAATIDADEVQRIFGDALSSLPPPPKHFTLYFRFDSEELTDESRRLVQDVLKAVKQRPEPDVLAIGHTDTTGSPAKNVELGLRRANTVRALLIKAGLAPTSIAVTSHGEAELLIPTANGVFEPRNRRVEITVR